MQIKNPKKLYILHKLPTPYNDDLFKALHAEEGIQLQVFHLWRGSHRRPWQTELGNGYPNYFMQTKFGVDWLSLKAAWFDKESLFMIGDWAHIPSIAMLIARIIRGTPVAVWTDTPQEQLHRFFLKRILRATFLRWLLRRVDIVFGSGQPAKRILVTMGTPVDRIVDLQFVVDLERPGSVAANQEIIKRANELRELVECADHGVVFCMNGTIDLKKKAQDLGLRAFAECCEQSQTPIGLVVSGAGEHLPQLIELTSQLGISDAVRFLGWQEPAQMDAIYHASDILLHPAHYDPFPLVVIEAMSWGVPVVGSDAAGSVKERVQNGVNGYVFPAGDQSALVEAMMTFINNPQLLDRAKIEARRTAEKWPMSRAVSTIKEQINRLC